MKRSSGGFMWKTNAAALMLKRGDKFAAIQRKTDAGE
jgi:hypothetical protein